MTVTRAQHAALDAGGITTPLWQEVSECERLQDELGIL